MPDFLNCLRHRHKFSTTLSDITKFEYSWSNLYEHNFKEILTYFNWEVWESWFVGLHCRYSKKRRLKTSVFQPFFGLRHPFLFIRIFDGALCWFNRTKFRGILPIIGTHSHYLMVPWYATASSTGSPRYSLKLCSWKIFNREYQNCNFKLKIG